MNLMFITKSLIKKSLPFQPNYHKIFNTIILDKIGLALYLRLGSWPQGPHLTIFILKDLAALNGLEGRRLHRDDV